MTKVKIDPGPCGFKAVVTAQMNDDDLAEVKVVSSCKAVRDHKMHWGRSRAGIAA